MKPIVTVLNKELKVCLGGEGRREGEEVMGLNLSTNKKLTN